MSEAAQDAAALGGGLLYGDPVELAAKLPERAIVRASAGADRIPAAWAAALEAADGVWVPGEHARAALERSGVSAERLRVVAPVVDVDRFTPDGPAHRPADAQRFVFGAALDWTRASGWDALVRAYAEEFSEGEDVTLAVFAWSSLGYTAPVVGETVLRLIDDLDRDPGSLADLIVAPQPSHAEPGPELYRGVDCFIAPARADAWGRRTLEAMACGRPLIAVDHGLTAELTAGAAVAIAAGEAPVSDLGARELPHLAGAVWGEPDIAALRTAMRAAFEGREDLAAAGKRARARAVAEYAPRALTPEPLAPRRHVSRGDQGARPQDVSFVLQGPVDRAGRGATARACEAIRAHFPGAEIVISTWAGTDASGLDCDAVVESEDPGAVGPNTFNPNTNRQIVSSLAGVRAATRPLVAKVRSDMLFTSDALLSHWRRWEERSDELRLFEHRLLVPNTFTRRPSYLSPYPLHPSDWSYFGTRGDLELLLDVPHMRLKESQKDRKPEGLLDLWHPGRNQPTYTPEQWIWAQAMRKADPSVGLRHVFDLTPETLRMTELSFANNLAVLDTYTQYGIWCPKYAWPNRLFDDVSLVQHRDWLELYERYCAGDAQPSSGADDLLRALAQGEGDDLTFDDVALLRSSGHAWEAQLLEVALIGDRIDRDTTTGGHHRWHLDMQIPGLACDHLPAAAAKHLSKAVTR
jgi:glycosyltransferase involved in cell wall biosynthesis